MNRAEEAFHMHVWSLIQTFKRPDVVAFHVPNGEKRDRFAAAKLKRMGVIAGVADFCIVADGRCHFLELKAPNGRTSRQQEAFAAAAETAGASYWLAHDLSEACDALNTIGACTRPLIASGVHDGPGAHPAGRPRAVSPDPSPRGTGAPA